MQAHIPHSGNLADMPLAASAMHRRSSSSSSRHSDSDSGSGSSQHRNARLPLSQPRSAQQTASVPPASLAGDPPTQPIPAAPSYGPAARWYACAAWEDSPAPSPDSAPLRPCPHAAAVQDTASSASWPGSCPVKAARPSDDLSGPTHAQQDLAGRTRLATLQRSAAQAVMFSNPIWEALSSCSSPTASDGPDQAWEDVAQASRATQGAAPPTALRMSDQATFIENMLRRRPASSSSTSGRASVPAARGSAVSLLCRGTGHRAHPAAHMTAALPAAQSRSSGSARTQALLSQAGSTQAGPRLEGSWQQGPAQHRALDAVAGRMQPKADPAWVANVLAATSCSSRHARQMRMSTNPLFDQQAPLLPTSKVRSSG